MLIPGASRSSLLIVSMASANRPRAMDASDRACLAAACSSGDKCSVARSGRRISPAIAASALDLTRSLAIHTRWLGGNADTAGDSATRVNSAVGRKRCVPSGSEIAQAVHDSRESQESQITIVGLILDYRAVFPAIEGGLAKTGKLGERGSGHPEPPANVAYFGGCQHTQMTAYGFVSQSFPFMVEKLEIACVAAANGKIDLQRRRRIARPVRECIEMSVRSDRVLAALRTFAVYVCLVVVHQHTVVRFHR